jgi:tRNA dimethylallyltransferase
LIGQLSQHIQTLLALKLNSMSKKKHLIIIAGPTAVGKTDLTVRLAQHYHTEIISCDSRQCFKELEIGTAKPTGDEMQGIPHHFIDCFPLEKLFSAGKFETAAIDLLENDLFRKYDVVLMSGGSGLYADAIIGGMNGFPEVPISVRQNLYEVYHQQGLPPLLAELEVCDPEYFKSVDHNNPQRIVRALEVIRVSGKPFSQFRTNQSIMRGFEIILIGLNRDRHELYDRINRRMDLMIEQGLFEEAKRLIRHRHHNALKTVGYKEIFAYFDDEYDREEAIRLLKRNSRRYAKRQLTWFQRYENMKWFHPNEERKIRQFIDKKIRQNNE